MSTVDTSLLQPGTRRTYSTAWWGMATVILTEGMVFLILIASYFFLWAAADTWPLDDIEVPKLHLALPFSFVLWGSSIPMFWAESNIRKGRVDRFTTGVAIAAVMGATFLAYTLYEFQDLHFGWRDNAYGSIYYTIVGLHATHLFVGLAMGVLVLLKARAGRYSEHRHTSAEVFALYWHFVDVVWLLVFPSLFLAPHLQ